MSSRSSTTCVFSAAPAAATNPCNNDTGDGDLEERWDGQYPSLWVADGGGGTFADIWTPDTFAQAGFVVTNTKTPGHVYELSNEHHMRNEIRFDHVENWDINAPQTEEEAGESPESVSLEIDRSHNITIANYHAYRVTRSRAPFPAAVRIYNSSDIHFRNVHINAESGWPICDENGCGTFLRVSKFPFENSMQDMTHHLEVREREFAVLDIPANSATACAADASAVLAAGATVKKLEDGFFSISGAAVDATGKLYFVDHHNQRIYSWSGGGHRSGARQSARSCESGLRQVGQFDRDVFVRPGSHGLHLPARKFRRRSHAFWSPGLPAASARVLSFCP